MNRSLRSTTERPQRITKEKRLLSDEVYQMTHNWQSIILYGLLGVLVGWAASFIWPSPYRATQELYVGINLYQLAEDEYLTGANSLKFDNADDYKNWQMANLNSLVFMDSVLDDTLTRLRSNDSAWNEVSRAELAKMLNVYWRNAGKWRLTAQHTDAQRAIQAVNAWQESSINQIYSSIEQARETMILDLQLRATIDQQTQLIAYKAGLGQIKATVENLKSQVSLQPPNQPLADPARQQIASLYEQLALQAPLLAPAIALPEPSAPASEYLAWLDRSHSAIEQSLGNTDAQITALDAQINEITARYATATQKSMGLSSNLVVDKTPEDLLLLTVVRPTGLLVFLGGLFGLIIWIFTRATETITKFKGD